MHFGRNSWMHRAIVASAIGWGFDVASLQQACAQHAPEAPASIAYAGDSVRLVHYPSEMRRRLARILKGEWEEGGMFTIAADGRVGNAGTPPQEAPDAFGRIQAYWSIFNSMANYVDFNRRLRADGMVRGTDAKAYCAGYNQGNDSDAHIWGCIPWSAAFVSWVFQTTGVLQREFPRGTAHREYVDALLTIFLNRRDSALFIPQNNGTYEPIAGDLICSDRSRSVLERLRSFEARIAETQMGKGSDRPMHCDIVSDVADSEVRAIGGNVSDRVAKTAYLVDGSGRLKGHESDVFVIFQNRTGIEP